MEKLLADLDPSKASGPDHIHCRFLKETAHELAPVFTCIFKQSIATATLPKVWTDAYVAPVFKKGPRCMPENYRPGSLTCVPCKILEHIIAKHYRDHLERHGILNSLNHGFRSKFSCETQLLLTLQDLLTFRDRKSQVDIAILDFSCWGSCSSTACTVLFWTGRPPSWRPRPNLLLLTASTLSRLECCQGCHRAPS